MNLLKKWVIFFSLFLCLPLFLAACGPAEEDDESQGGGFAVTAVGTGEAPATAAATAASQSGVVSNPQATEAVPVGEAARVVWASQIIGLNISTTAGENMGEVTEVLFDPQGALRYILFNAGELTQSEARVVALPWEMFTPSFTDEAASGGSLIYRGEASDVEVAPAVGLEALAEGNLVTDAAALQLPAEAGGLLRASQFTLPGVVTFSLAGAEGEVSGSVEDLLLDLRQGRVYFAAVNMSDPAAPGQTMVAVPWERFQLDQEAAAFVLDVTREMLAGAPLLDLSRWDENTTVEDWDAEVGSFWQVGPPPESPGAGTSEAGALGAETPVTGTPEAGSEPESTNTLIRAGNLSGLTISQAEGGAVAQAENVLFDAQGVIHYIIFDAASFLGDDERLTAVPWEAFTFTSEAQLRQLSYREDAAALEAAPAVNQEALGGGDTLIVTGDFGIEMPAESDYLIPLDRIADFQLVNSEGVELGQVQDALLNLAEGRLTYLVADVGGFEGLAETTVALPWERVEPDPQAGAFILSAGEDVLTEAPALDMSGWDDFGPTAAGWDGPTRDFWLNEGETHPVAEAVEGNEYFMRASTLIGLGIRNEAGEDLGEVWEAVVGVEGVIQYLFFDSGGLLEAGQSTTVAAWSTFRADPEGFDDPNAQILIYQGDVSSLDLSSEVDLGLLQEEGDILLEPETWGLPAELGGLRLSVFDERNIGAHYDLLAQDGEDLGDIEDLILNLATGQIDYAVVESGGFLGLGETFIAVPWSLLQLDADAAAFTLEANKEVYRNSPTLNWGDMVGPTSIEPDWDDALRVHWSEHLEE